MRTPTKLNIRTKLAIIFTITLFIAIGASSLLWSQTVRGILQKEITLKQNQLGTRASEKIEGFLDTKIRALIIHSQSAAFLTQDTNSQKLDLSIFLTQDQDIHELTIINPQGQETMHLVREGNSFSDDPSLENRSSHPSFLTNTSRYTKEYIGSVEFNEQKEPFMLVSVPIKAPTTIQRLTELTTQDASIVTSSNEIFGVLEAKVILNSLFNEITDLGLDQDTSVFIVDKEGRIIGHADTSLVKPDVVADKYPPVKQHAQKISQGPIATEEESTIFVYLDENNVEVLGSYSPVKETGWAIVAQQSISKVYAGLNQVLSFAVLFLLASIAVSIPFVYFFSKKITNPILALTEGANKISEGNLYYQIKVTTHDELADLAFAFNNMTQKLKDSIAEIKSERNKLEVVIYGIEDAVIAVNKNLGIILVNHAAQKLIGISETEVIGKNLDSVFKLSDKGSEVPWSTYCPQLSDSTEGIVYEKKGLKLKTANEGEKYINLISGKIKENMHSEVEFILTIHDVTAEQKLEEMKLDFVSMTAHELRTPLTSIVGYSAMLIEETKKVLAREHLNIIERIYLSGKRLSNLVDNLLSVSHIERGELKMQLAPLDLVDSAKATIDEMKQLAAAKNQELSFVEPGFAKAMIIGDKFKITEVFTNLIENAIKYTHEHGAIKVSIEEQSSSFVVEIKDNGQGIPADALPNLFTKFFRVANGLEQGSKGTGLGLYITRSIITLHKGKIWAESKPGEGTAIFFKIPKPPQEKLDSHPPIARTPAASGIFHNHKRVYTS